MADIPEIHDMPADHAHDEQRLRVERERAMLAVGVAQLDRGEYLEEGELEAWLDKLDNDPDAPLPPRPGRTH